MAHHVGFEYLLPQAQDTGVGHAIRNLLAALLDTPEDFRFTVFGTGAAPDWWPEAALSAWCPVRAARWGRCGRLLWQQVPSVARLSARNLDFYHASGYVLGGAAATPAVVTLYDTLALDAPHLTKRLNALHYRWAVPRGLRRAARVLVPSSFVADRVVNRGLASAESVRVVPLGISEAFHHKHDAEAAWQPTPALRWKKYLLCVGTVERKKNIEQAIRTFAAWSGRMGPEWRLVLAGKHGNASRSVKCLAEAEGVAERVLWPGYVTEEQLVSLYRGAFALLYPSWHEGFGLPVLEAMACGTPALVADTSALGETGGAAAIVLPPDEPRAWVDALEGLANVPWHYRLVQITGESHASRFTWRRAAAQVREVYREVVEESRKKQAARPQGLLASLPAVAQTTRR